MTDKEIIYTLSNALNILKDNSLSLKSKEELLMSRDNVLRIPKEVMYSICSSISRELYKSKGIHVGQIDGMCENERMSIALSAPDLMIVSIALKTIEKTISLL
jgi:hypothetical protein